MRGVTTKTAARSSNYLFQLTRLMRGVTHWVRLELQIRKISTHTPHARRDYYCYGYY